MMMKKHKSLQKGKTRNDLLELRSATHMSWSMSGSAITGERTRSSKARSEMLFMFLCLFVDTRTLRFLKSGCRMTKLNLDGWMDGWII